MKRSKPELTIRWSRKEGALLYEFNGSQSKAVGGCAASVFERLDAHQGRSFTQYLEDVGYDLTTLRFQIRKKKEV
jgi:hypothetical protein